MRKELMPRREFLKRAGQGLIGASCLSVFLPACRREEAGNGYDLVIRQALIFDGSGQPPFRADVGISGNYIKQIGKIGKSRGWREIPAENQGLSPGFIDVHNHTDIELLVCPTADSLIKQGVTTVIGGNCGSSRFPLTPAMLEDEDKYLSSEFGLKVDWQDLAGFFRRLAEKGQAVNFASLVGQGTILAAVVGYNNRPPST
jgi:N-acyl-D-amino-acid deacylase